MREVRERREEEEEEEEGSGRRYRDLSQRRLVLKALCVLTVLHAK
jgi:hypothetical protein